MNALRITPLALVVVVVVALFAACAESIESGNEGKRPSEVLAATVAAAKAGDVEKFKLGLSRDFIAAVERYQELGGAKDELKGAFDWPVFMRSMTMNDPAPKEELVRGNRATVRALQRDGTEASTEMILEDGAWKLAVPPGMVKGLDHFGDVAKLAMGQPIEEKPDIPTGGGGKADRTKSLPPDASEEARAKAGALDAFDLGDVESAAKLLEEALKKNAGDEELVVALGRAHVQLGKADDAIALYEGHLKANDKAAPVRHYLGMAYMLKQQPAKAADEWQRVMEIDGVYGSRFRLDQRAAAARAMAAGDGAPAHGDVVPGKQEEAPPHP